MTPANSAFARLRSIVFVVVTALVLSLGVAAAAPAMAAVPVADEATAGLSVTASAGNVLAGGTRTVSVSGSNPDGVDLFNALGVVLLPVGVTYAAGTVSPSNLGEPEIQYWTPDPDDPDPENPAQAQMLVWSNVADLPAGSAFDASFGVVADPDRYPAGSTFVVGAGLYATDDEREVPEVTVPTSGVPEVSGATEGGSAEATVLVVPITISKAETANAEAEVYRGSANPATFALTVQAAPDGATEGVVVVDDVPAQFTVTDCSAACTQAIVEVDGEVFTRLTWNLGTVSPGPAVVLTYSAYVADTEVTLPDAEEPGASTRPGPDGYGVTNEATLTGTYVGDVAEGTDTAVSVSDDTTVRVLDLGVVKSVSDSTFIGGESVDYTLAVRSSEYISSSAITITDTIPNGMCPLLPAGLAQGGDAWPDECADLDTGAVTGAEMLSADFDGESGEFTLTFALADLATDEDVNVTYSAYMRRAYQNGTPTATGDGFTNEVTVSGTTTDADGATSAATNDSAATLGTTAPSLDKTIWPNASRAPITAVTGSGTTCASGEGEYVSPTTGALPTYQLGDLVCFKIEAVFPQGVSTRSVNVSDYLPPGMQLVGWEQSAANTTPIAATSATPGASSARWNLGAPDEDGVLFVEQGATASLYVLARVASVPKTTPRVAGNLAKMRYSTEGTRVVNLRDEADLRLSPPPPLALSKKVDGQESLSPVEEGQELTYTIDVTNTGTVDGSNGDPIDEIEVWDRLPAGFSCADIQDEDPAVDECTDAPEGALVSWVLDLSADPLAGQETTTISYTLVVPSPLSISSTHTNTAAVVRYTPVTTDGITPESSRATFYPENPLDAYPDQATNAPEASDTATIGLAGAAVAKSVTATSINAAGNDQLAQATIGETVTWQYSATVPARTSIFNGLLDEQAPAASRWATVTAPTLTAPVGVATGVGCAPDSSAVLLCADATSSAYGDVIFPQTWTNESESPASFVVTWTVRLRDVAANANTQTFPNTVVLTSTPSAASTGAVERGRATAPMSIVEPAPSLTKVASPTTGAVAGTLVTYTLTAGNAATRSPLYNSTVLDCLPAGLTLVPGSLGTGVVATPGTALDCGIGSTAIRWTPAADPLLGGSTQTTTYQATVDAPAGAGRTLTNTATITGYSVPSSMSDERRSYSVVRTATVTTRTPSITKTASPTTIVPGQPTTWTLTVTIPANVTLYNPAIVDALPAQFGTNGTGAITAVSAVTCDAAWTTACPTLQALTNTASTGSTSRQRGFTVWTGTDNVIPAAATQRTMTFTITTLLPASFGTASTPAATVNATNTANLRWRALEGAAATNVANAMSTSFSGSSGSAAVAIREPNVSTVKSVSNPSVPKGQGDTFTYSVTASASGGVYNVPAFNVKIVDKVPAGVVPVVSSISPGGVWDSSQRTITWTIAQLDVAAPRTFTYDARLDEAATLTGAALVNTATPASWQSLATDGKSYASTAGATASVTPAFPKIDAAKAQLTPNPVYIGQEVSYSITLTNTGSARAVSLSAVDTLPDGWSFVSGSALLGDDALADPEESGQELTWADLGPLAPTESLTITYRAVPGDDVEVGSAVDHTNTVTAANVTDATGGTSYDDGRGSYIGVSDDATARIDQADLAITKTAGTFTAGGTGTFDLTVKNNGGDPAVGLAVAEDLDLPDGVTFVSAGGDGWFCSTPDAEGEFVCTRTSTAAVPSGTTLPVITVTVAIAATVASGTDVPNTAVVSARTEDGTPRNDTATATGEVVTSADLAVVKRVVTPASGAVIAGESISWSITLTNNGPSVSRGSEGSPIVLEDELPANVSDLELTGTVPDGCEIDAGELRCDIAHDLAVGESVVVSVSGTVDSDVEAGEDVVSNSAEVTPVTDDPNTDNDSSTTETDVDVRENLSIVKAITAPAPPSDVTPGDRITYTLQVHNSGPSDARGVYIDDVLPADMVFDSIVGSGSGWSADVDGSSVRFSYGGTVAAGADAPLITYTATLDPAFVGEVDQLTNVAWVSSAWQANQDSSDATPGEVSPEADLELTKSVRPGVGVEGEAVIAGETAVYSFTVDNLGPSDADAVTVTDTLPVGMSVEGDLPDGCSAEGRVITCVLPDGLDADADPWTFEITVRVDAAFTGSRLLNAAEADSSTDDINPLNNADVAALDVIQRATLHVDKTPSAETITAGTGVTWTVEVHNDGPSDAQNVTLSDVLDGRLILVSATSEADGVTCSGSASITCTLGTLAAGDTVEVSVVTTVRSSVADGASIPNAATAVSTTIDPATDEPAIATGDADVDVVAEAALTLDKSTTTPTVSAGAAATFVLKVGNEGPSDAAATVQITDTLPEGMTFVSASTVGGPAVWACESADGVQIVCDLQDAGGEAISLAAGVDAPGLRIVAIVDPAQSAGVLTNTATVTSPSDLTPAVDEAEVTIVTFADLGITKENIGTPTAGEDFSWTITVTNHGPSDSVATADDPIFVTDELPAGVAFVSAQGEGASCSATGDPATVTCEIADTMAPGDTVAITLRVAVDEAVSGAIVNTATVTPGLTDEPEGAVWPNEATNETPPVNEVADLAIVKTVTTPAADIVAGGQVAWELTVTNLGPSDSDADAETPIVVTDTLPIGVLADSATGPDDDWSCSVSEDRTSVACALSADLATADPQTITVIGTIDPSTRGTITNTASVAPGLTAQPDTDEAAANDEDSASSLVNESADLRLLKGISEQIVAGATGRYLLQVYNAGPSAARDVTITDTLPAVLSFVRVVPVDGETESSWSCAASDVDAQVVECAYDGTIAPGEDPVELVVEVSAASDLTGEVVNTATVGSSTPDPDPENNTDDVSGTLVTTADLVVSKSHDEASSAVAGEEFTWTITVTNEGPSDSIASVSQPITVTDVLAEGTTFVADGSGAACTAAGQTVSCVIAETIPAGASVEVPVRVLIDDASSGELENTASAAPGGTVDPDLSNNTGSDAVTVTEVADLAIVKSVATAAGEIVAGEQIAWTVTVSNLGPSNSDASEDDPIRVTDTLPAGVSFVSAVGEGWTCEPGDESGERETVECVRTTDLAVGDAPVITVTGSIAPDVQGEVRNDVVVAPGLTPEPAESTANNSADATATVLESADLVLTKAISATISAGAGGQYTLTVTNLGPSAARDIAIVDTLPSGISFAGASGDGWTCAVDPGDAQRVVCAFDGILAPAQTLTVLIDVAADATLQGDIVNTAVVSASTPDPDLDNNTDAVSGTVAETVDLSIVKTPVGDAVVGEEFAYELTVANAGPATARGVLVEDTLPEGLEIVGASGDGWTCGTDAEVGAISCTLAELAPGETAAVVTVEVRVLPAAYPEVANTATVSSTTPESEATLDDNTSTATVSVPPLSALVITKELVDDLVTGQQARYEITVTNDGPTVDPGPITITDPMPEGLVARAATLSGAEGTCEIAGAQATCTVDALAVGQTATVVVTVDVLSTAAGEIVNVASASSDASGTPVDASAAGTVTVVELPNTGGALGLWLPFGLALLALGLLALWWARRSRQSTS